jgi:hypothetical protein
MGRSRRALWSGRSGNRLPKFYLPPTSEIARGSSIAAGRVMTPTRSGRNMSCVQPELCPNNNSQYSQLSESNGNAER